MSKCMFPNHRVMTDAEFQAYRAIIAESEQSFAPKVEGFCTCGSEALFDEAGNDYYCPCCGATYATKGDLLRDEPELLDAMLNAAEMGVAASG